RRRTASRSVSLSPSRHHRITTVGGPQPRPSDCSSWPGSPSSSLPAAVLKPRSANADDEDGRVPVNLHPVTDEVAETVLPEAAGTSPAVRVPLGRLFVNAGLLTETQVDDALREGSQTGERLGEVVVRRGLVTEEKVAQL